MNEMKIILLDMGETSERCISTALRELTAALQEITGEGPHGILGGEHGYGCEYENDVFMMHPYCWCEGFDCPWCLSCGCPNEYEYRSPSGELITEKEFFALSFDDYEGRRKFDNMKFVGETCANCLEQPERAANFLYKPTGAKVNWYKYIGRGMELDGNLPRDFLAKCLESLKDSE